MRHIIFKRLFDSFAELENAISSAKKTLERKSNCSLDLLDRVQNYEAILKKQRALAADLAIHVVKEDWKEVSRHVQIINGLSTMIRDDAREILSGLQLTVTPEEREALYT